MCSVHVNGGGEEEERRGEEEERRGEEEEELSRKRHGHGHAYRHVVVLVPGWRRCRSCTWWRRGARARCSPRTRPPRSCTCPSAATATAPAPAASLAAACNAQKSSRSPSLTCFTHQTSQTFVRPTRLTHTYSVSLLNSLIIRMLFIRMLFHTGCLEYSSQQLILEYCSFIFRLSCERILYRVRMNAKRLKCFSSVVTVFKVHVNPKYYGK